MPSELALLLNLEHLLSMKTRQIMTQTMLAGCLALLAGLSTATAQTTNVFYEGFETSQALDDWFADSGTWEIGVPTFGPATNLFGQRAFGGTKCAATVLGGNYIDNVTTRLISPPIAIAANASSPRLRFWHWYSFNRGDKGEVQIKVGAGAWVTISPTYTTTGGGVWTRPSIDLSAYIGQTVQVGFLFTSIDVSDGSGIVNQPETSAGWYIDDVAVVSGSIIFNNAESFELGLGDWSVTQGSWEVGPPTSGPGNAHAGLNCAGTVLAGNYLETVAGANGVSSHLVSPPFVVPPVESSPRLRFWHWYSFNRGDEGKVQIKVGTNAWQTISTTYATTSGGVWSRPSIDLTAYAGQTVRVGFLFTATDAYDGSGIVNQPETSTGWYIDEVKLTHDFALLLDSANVRAQQNFCLPIRVFASDPATHLRFSVTIPGASLANVTLDTGDRFATATITQGTGSDWIVELTTTPGNPVNGDEIIGSLCFRASAPKSAFAPLAVQSLVVTNLSGSQPRTVPFGGRAVVIANEALLEAWSGANGERTISLYGKPNTSYELQRTADLNPPIAWTPEWTNSVPAGMFRSVILDGPQTNAPILYLRAKER